MKFKFIASTLAVISIILATGCTAKTLDTKDVKVIEKNNTETIGENSSEENGKNSTENKNSDLKEKEEVLKEDTEEYFQSIIGSRPTEVLTAIKNYDMVNFSKMVHPEKGVRFSPYAYVNESKDLVFTADKIIVLDSDVTEYTWGDYDGSGEPIKLTFSDYYKRFIYDADFINAKEVGYNRTIGQGNTINNSFQFYQNSIIIEYHFPGIDPKYEGMDWRSLRVVFEKYNNAWYVVGIIHDEWTI
ncbi:hypothetical protein [Clostridium thermarum]|uniref:hypothetical protein n=1 Tax=Clostridium thermarum TaxID=1716543 RepID=UPI0013D5FD9A|nr:hypothetical protein [Clostridium thermarum]